MTWHNSGYGDYISSRVKKLTFDSGLTLYVLTLLRMRMRSPRWKDSSSGWSPWQSHRPW